MKSTVIIFPGSNCDRDISSALQKYNFQNKMLWHNETELPKTDLVVLPGGFSYGDYLRTGSIAAKSKIINEVIKHSNNGGLVLGICNGFQILIETGLLPGILLRNKKLKFISKDVYVKVTNKNSKYFKEIKQKILKWHIAHNEGNFFANENIIKKLQDNDQIAIKYCDVSGVIKEDFNPNGSIENIAGILNEQKNILGMMPHPERAVNEDIYSNDGKFFFESLLS